MFQYQKLRIIFVFLQKFHRYIFPNRLRRGPFFPLVLEVHQEIQKIHHHIFFFLTKRGNRKSRLRKKSQVPPNAPLAGRATAQQLLRVVILYRYHSGNARLRCVLCGTKKGAVFRKIVCRPGVFRTENRLSFDVGLKPDLQVSQVFLGVSLVSWC